MVKSLNLTILIYLIKIKHKVLWACASFKTKGDVIQAPKDPLKVPVGLVTRFKAKRFKEAFNGLLQDT
jgi:hypothetical protein